MLLGFVILYLVVSLGIGFYAATKVHNAKDYIAAGRSLPLYIVMAMVFATWFGAETVLGIPATFMEEDLGGLISDPFGASLCLILFGLFFARKLYRMNLLTIGDFYRERFGRNVEVITGIAIALSYLGWVSAQVTALGLVFNVLSDGQITQQQGILIGAAVVLMYTLYGGMWSVALTTFFQMIVIVIGLLYIAWLVSGMTGGVAPVIEHAAGNAKFHFWPELNAVAMVAFISGLLTMGFGSIPQQDVFQRVMSSDSAETARRGPVIGGLLYLAFAFIPMFVVTAAVLVMPETPALLKDDPQKILPTLVMAHMPVLLQVAFFGALLSAIMSTASATLLAPSTTFVENILRNLHPGMSDAQTLKAMRISVLVFTGCVLTYAITMKGSSIYDLVSGAYQVPLVGAFVPLVFGLYWHRATTQGALLAVVLGIGVWLLFAGSPMLHEAFPQQLAGLLAALIGMFAGSLAPQWVADHKGHVHHFEGSAAA